MITVEKSEVQACFLCGKSSSSYCQSCGKAGFCSTQHEKLHRPDNFCFPFKVEFKKNKGRVLVATREIQPLELIMWDEAAVAGPRMGGHPVCLNCLKPAKKESVCSKCAWPVCNDDCENGNNHRIECEILSKSTMKFTFENIDVVNEIYRCIAPLRLLLIKEKSPETWERLSYLMDHNIERKQDEEMWSLYQNNVNRVLKSCNNNFDNEEIDRCVGLLWTNSFACASGGGQALFPSFSFASHSCKPNCAHSVFPNKTLALQSKVYIEPGEELTISYISTLQGTLRRKLKLETKWFFNCTCERCLDCSELGSHVSTLLCQVCKQFDAVLLSKDITSLSAMWSCTKCKNEIGPDEINEIESRITTQLQQRENKNVLYCEKILEDAGVFLHRHHYLMLLLKRHLTGLQSKDILNMSEEKLNQMKKFCEEIIETYDVIDPGYYKEKGVVTSVLCEVKKCLIKKYYQAGNYSEEQIKKKVEECSQLFHDYQKCMTVRVKKEVEI